MTQYISEIDVSVNDQDENRLFAAGYTAVPRNLNRGTGGNKIYLWYKLGGQKPITRIQLSYNLDMSKTLQVEKYQKVEKNLNEGASGDPIYLLYYKGSTEHDLPIVNIDVSIDVEDEVKMFKFGWEKLACNLNRGTGGTKVYLWVKREKQGYVCDITANTLGENDHQLTQNGYIRVDEGTNKNDGDNIFIWYRRSRDPTESVITDLQVSTNDDERDKYKSQGYSKVKKNVNETEKPINIWFKKGPQSDGIKTTTLITDPNAVKPYKDGNIKVNDNSLNMGSNASTVYLCFYK